GKASLDGRGGLANRSRGVGDRPAVSECRRGAAHQLQELGFEIGGDGDSGPLHRIVGKLTPQQRGTRIGCGTDVAMMNHYVDFMFSRLDGRNAWRADSRVGVLGALED